MREVLQEGIFILDSNLVYEFAQKIKLIDRWKKALCIQPGWHYDLDFIWILNQLEKMQLPVGSTILDAGAGNGLMQFILASCGYNIVSLDFAERDVPFAVSKIFKVGNDFSVKAAKVHRYQNFIDHRRNKLFTKQNISKIFKNPFRAAGVIFGKPAVLFNPAMWKEVFSPQRKRFGAITYLSVDFRNLDLFLDHTFDCIVSVSAIEHDDPPEIEKAVRELERVLKKDAYMLITTGAARDKDWYFEICQAWCFTYQSLARIFRMPGCPTNFNKFDEFFTRLKNCALIKKRIPKIYFRSGSNGLPWGIYDPKYQPVGVIKQKRG